MEAKNGVPGMDQNPEELGTAGVAAESRADPRTGHSMIGQGELPMVGSSAFAPAEPAGGLVHDQVDDGKASQKPGNDNSGTDGCTAIPASTGGKP